MRQSILAVDDEPHMLKLLERIVSEKTPYAVQTTNNALEVADLLNQREFDLVVTDLKMPGMDGMEILDLVKEQGRGEEVTIITAFGSLETAIEALGRGVFDYITKPFKKEQIISTIDRAMRWQSVKREAARLGAVFDTEPFEQASEAFRGEYLRRLAERCDNDPDRMAERSGLDRQTVAGALTPPSPDGQSP